MAWLISYRYRKISNNRRYDSVGEIRDGFAVSRVPAAIWLLEKRQALAVARKTPDEWSEHEDVFLIHSATEFSERDLPEGYEKILETSKHHER